MSFVYKTNPDLLAITITFEKSFFLLVFYSILLLKMGLQVSFIKKKNAYSDFLKRAKKLCVFVYFSQPLIILFILFIEIQHNGAKVNALAH